jgi:hypothetical protein
MMPVIGLEKAKPGSEGDYDIVPIFRKRIEQTFKFKI